MAILSTTTAAAFVAGEQRRRLGRVVGIPNGGGIRPRLRARLRAALETVLALDESGVIDLSVEDHAALIDARDRIADGRRL